MQVTEYQMDALKELVNIGVGKAAGALNQMLRAHVSLIVPHLQLLSLYELEAASRASFGVANLAAVSLEFWGPFSGNAALVFPPDSAAKLVDIVTGEDFGGLDWDELRVGALTEIGNIVLNGVMGSIGNILKQHIDYSLPRYTEDTITRLMTRANTSAEATILLAQTHFAIAEYQIEGDIVLLFEVGAFDTLLTAIENFRPGQ